jgi:excisionase family DNA binding protein
MASFLTAQTIPRRCPVADVPVLQIQSLQEVADFGRASSAARHRSCEWGSRSIAPMDMTSTANASTSNRVEPQIGRSVSLDKAAVLLGVSRRTVYNRIREGRLQTIRTMGGSQRVLLDSVQNAQGHSG